MVDSRVKGLIAFLTPVVLLLPFAGKAFHIDDPLFLAMARHIDEHPFDPFGVNFNWDSATKPMYLVNQNPPAIAYWLAGAGAIAGWSEIAMHLAMATLAGFAGLGIYVLALNLCSRPLTATLIAVLSPGFFVSATTVMSDVPMTGLYAWSLAAWIAGLRQNRHGLLQTSAVLVGIATLMKYFAVTLIPLMLVYTVLTPQKPRGWAWHFLTPVAIVGAYVAWGYWRYETNLFTFAAGFALNPQWRVERSPIVHFLTAVAFTGACGGSLLAMTPLLWPRRALGVLIAALVALLIALGLSWAIGRMTGDWSINMPYRAQIGVWVLAGVQIAVLMGLELRRRRDADAALLVCWIAGTFIFSAYLNHMINARTLLPMLPALGILAARRMDELAEGTLVRQRWSFVPLSAAALLALWVAAGDYEYANASRTAARQFSENRSQFSEHVYFADHWGFQYYMEQAGGRAREKKKNHFNAEFYRPMQKGDTLAIAHARESNGNAGHQDDVIVRYAYPLRWRMNTMTSGAGFYSHFWGVLPFVIGTSDPIRFVFVRLSGDELE